MGENSTSLKAPAQSTGLERTGWNIGRFVREARRSSGWGGLLYILPAFVILLTFEFWPLIFGAFISLWRWDIGPVDFIGLQNYARLFSEGFITRDFKGDLAVGEVLNSLIVTVYYVIFTVPVAMVSGFFVAYLLFRGVRGQGILRTMYFLPYITASVAVTIVFAWIFDPLVGVANAVLEFLGLPVQRWLQEPTPILHLWFGMDWLPEFAAGPSLAMVVIILYSIWSSLGFNVVIYLAGLTSVSRDVIEAARLDGASELLIIRTIIWPLVSPTTFFLLITSVIGAFQVFSPIYTLTRNSGMGRAEAGGPLDSTLTITVYIYRNFYERSNSVGYAAAVSMLLFAILLTLTLIQFRVGSRAVHYQ
jgi:multiple sugar transport system permease protein